MTSKKTPVGHRTRLALAAVMLAIPALTVLASWLQWREKLPERVAFHWDAAGRVDGTILAEPLFAMAMTTTVLAFAIGVVVLLAPRIDPRTKRSSMYWLGAIAAFTAVGWLLPAGLTYRAGSASGAHLEGWLAMFLLALLYGVIPYLLTPKLPPENPRSPRPIALKPTETGAWSGTITTRSLYLVALAAGGLGIGLNVVALVEDEFSALNAIGIAVAVLAVLAVLAFASLRVTVDWRGLRVISLLTGVPLQRIPLNQIQDVQVADLHPAEWGGWGYRVMSGKSAVIVRSGPGIVITTHDGKQFALSLRNPEAPAGLLHTLADVTS